MRDAKADKFAKHKAEVKTKSEKDQAEFDLSNAGKMLEGVSEELQRQTTTSRGRNHNALKSMSAKKRAWLLARPSLQR